MWTGHAWLRIMEKFQLICSATTKLRLVTFVCFCDRLLNTAYKFVCFCDRLLNAAYKFVCFCDRLLKRSIQICMLLWQIVKTQHTNLYAFVTDC